MIRFGLVGTNTSHARVFARIFNGDHQPGGCPPALPGGTVVAVWGKRDAPVLADACGIGQVVREPEEMLSLVDAVLVVDDTGGGASHADLARPFLQAGLPTFIDKPMTLDIADAIELFDLAERHGAPLMSASALRFAVELDGLCDRLPGLGDIRSVVSIGPGDWYYYGVHAVEMYLSVISESPSWVHGHSFEQRDVVVIGHDNGPSVVVQTLRDAAYGFHLNLYGAEDWAACQVLDHEAFYTRLMGAVLQMAQTGRPPVSRQQTLRVLAVLGAGERSLRTGERVEVAEHLAR